MGGCNIVSQLLDLRILFVTHDWQQVIYQYNNVTKENAEVLRIKKKFNSLANERKPTGGALMTATVSEAKKIKQLIDERIGSGIEGIPTSSSIGDDTADDADNDDDNPVSFNNSQVYDNDVLNDDLNDIDIEPTQPLPALPSTLLQSAQSNVSAVLQQLDPTATSTTTTAAATATAVPNTQVPVYTLSSPNAVNKRKRSNNDIMSTALQAATASETSNNNNMMSMMLQQERMMMMMMNQQRTEHREIFNNLLFPSISYGSILFTRLYIY